MAVMLILRCESLNKIKSALSALTINLTFFKIDVLFAQRISKLQEVATAEKIFVARIENTRGRREYPGTLNQVTFGKYHQSPPRIAFRMERSEFTGDFVRAI